MNFGDFTLRIYKKFLPLGAKMFGLQAF